MTLHASPVRLGRRVAKFAGELVSAPMAPPLFAEGPAGDAMAAMAAPRAADAAGLEPPAPLWPADEPSLPPAAAAAAILLPPDSRY